MRFFVCLISILAVGHVCFADVGSEEVDRTEAYPEFFKDMIFEVVKHGHMNITGRIDGVDILEFPHLIVDGIGRLSEKYPELGDMEYNAKPQAKAWIYWYKTAGKGKAEKSFKEKYSDYVKNKQKVKLLSEEYGKLSAAEKAAEHKRFEWEKGSTKRRRRDLIDDDGIAVLPLLIEKIESGESDLIDILSQLTDRNVGQDWSCEQVLEWWKKNKEKWTIFPEKKSDARDIPGLQFR